MFKKKPGYSTVLQASSGKRSGRVLVDGDILRITTSKPHSSTTELPISRIESITEFRDSHYRVTLRVGVDAYQFLMTPQDGKALADEIRGVQNPGGS